MRPNPLIPIWMGMVAFSRRLRGLVEGREVEKWQKQDRKKDRANDENK